MRETKSVSERVDRLIAAQASSAAVREVPPDVVAEARRATRAAFIGTTRTHALDTRVARYFDRVVTRAVVRRRDSGRAAARLVAASVIDELRGSGRRDVDVIDELERGWGALIPHDIIAEYRQRLCA